MSGLNEQQCEFILAKWFEGHVHGVETPQPILPDENGWFRYESGGCMKTVGITTPPLSELIDLGFVQVCDPKLGSVLFTQKTENIHDEIVSDYALILKRKQSGFASNL